MHKIVQNRRSRNEVDIGPAIEQEQETIWFIAPGITSRGVDPDAPFIIENLAAQAMGIKLPFLYVRLWYNPGLRRSIRQLKNGEHDLFRIGYLLVLMMHKLMRIERIRLETYGKIDAAITCIRQRIIL